MSDETLGVADITEILRLLPHRYPFLLVDRVINMRGDQHGVGIKNLTVNEWQFGHSAENPVMPGVLVIEGIAQTACVLALRLMPPTERRRIMFFMSIDKAKFRKPARPATRSNITSTRSPNAATCVGIEVRRRSAASSSPRQNSAPTWRRSKWPG